MLTSCSRFRSFPLPTRFLSSASLPLPATQPSALPFLLFPVPPHICFPSARLRSRFLGFLFLSDLISHVFLPDSCTRPSVCFLSLFPDSLPQLFLRCLPLALAFGIFHFRLAFFRPLIFRFQLLSLLFLPFLFLPAFASHWLSRCALSAFASLAFPALSDLVSRVFLPGSSYSAFCQFPFVPPGSAPTAAFPVPPFCFRFRAFSLSVAFFRPLRSGSDYSAFRSFFSLLPVFPCRRFLRCCPSALRLPRFSSSAWPVAMPCFRFGTLLTAILFSIRCLASQWLLQRLGSPLRSSLFPFACRSRFWLLSLRFSAFRLLPVCRVSRQRLISYHKSLAMSTTFSNIFCKISQFYILAKITIFSAFILCNMLCHAFKSLFDIKKQNPTIKSRVYCFN